MCLASKSRRPNNSPKKLSQEDEDLICDMSTDYGNSDRLLAILIYNKKGKKRPHSSINYLTPHLKFYENMESNTA